MPINRPVLGSSEANQSACAISRRPRRHGLERGKSSGQLFRRLKPINLCAIGIVVFVSCGENDQEKAARVQLAPLVQQTMSQTAALTDAVLNVPEGVDFRFTRRLFTQYSNAEERVQTELAKVPPVAKYNCVVTMLRHSLRQNIVVAAERSQTIDEILNFGAAHRRAEYYRDLVAHGLAAREDAYQASAAVDSSEARIISTTKEANAAALSDLATLD